MTTTLVGVEPAGATGVARRLRGLEAELDAQARRVQSLLDAAGVTSSVPREIRGVSRTCGDAGMDLTQRTSIVQAPLPIRGRPPDLCLPGAGVLVPGMAAMAVAGPLDCRPGAPGLPGLGLPGGYLGGVLVDAARPARRWTEAELGGSSEILTEAEKQAVRDKQGGRSYDKDTYDSARGKLVKSQKVAGTRNARKQRGQPRRK